MKFLLLLIYLSTWRIKNNIFLKNLKKFNKKIKQKLDLKVKKRVLFLNSIGKSDKEISREIRTKIRMNNINFLKDYRQAYSNKKLAVRMLRRVKGLKTKIHFKLYDILNKFDDYIFY